MSLVLSSKQDVEALEKLTVQLQALHSEISQLAKKSPNDGLNRFKLKVVNDVLIWANGMLLGSYQPVQNFTEFDEHLLPTNSDVTVVLALYIKQAERFRSSCVTWDQGKWVYLINGELSDIATNSPTRVGG